MGFVKNAGFRATLTPSKKFVFQTFARLIGKFLALMATAKNVRTSLTQVLTLPSVFQIYAISKKIFY